MKGNETIDVIISLLNKDIKENRLITPEEFERNKEKIRENILKLEEFVDGVVAVGDENFPPYRGNVKNSEQPIVLFYRGNLSLLKEANKNITVIGLLNPDIDIKIREQKVVAELVKNGATIISGLALGCDSIAHSQALQLKGKTVAILPSPLNNILPAKNIELANEIVKNNGLLITEYHENVKSKTELDCRYQDRDRLQALFSDGIILSASYAKNDQGNDSGSRLAMEYALKYSIPRSVMYDPVTDITNPKYDLNRQLKDNKEITIIDRDNLVLKVKEIMANKAGIKNHQSLQPNLFNSM